MNLAERFGENLKQARKRAGISQEELAVRASLHRTEIGLVERGERSVRLETAIKLAGAAGVPLAELVAGVEWSPGFSERGRFEATEATRKGGDQAEQVSSSQRANAENPDPR